MIYRRSFMANNQGKGNFGNPKQHAKAGKKGAEAQSTEAKSKGGQNSSSSD